MRLSEFRELMIVHFGAARAASVASDHVFSALDGRTANEALAAGVDTKRIWLTVCDAFEVPAALRHGLPD